MTEIVNRDEGEEGTIAPISHLRYFRFVHLFGTNLTRVEKKTIHDRVAFNFRSIIFKYLINFPCLHIRNVYYLYTYTHTHTQIHTQNTHIYITKTYAHKQTNKQTKSILARYVKI